jgi:quercetin 2,3-dioxygenase
LRKVRLITDPLRTSVGPFTVRQPLPTNALRDLDPFLLLHHAGPHEFTPGSEGAKIDAHPHRGFEPVTFVFRGSVLHRDSLGNEGVIGAGEVQWITSGRGIMHEEGPTPEMARDGGEVELIQLWINLPAEKKMMEPAYQELHRDAIPKVDLLDGSMQLAVVAGTLNDAKGPAVTQTPLFAAMASFKEGGSGTVNVSDMPAHAAYILNGEVRINGDHEVQGGRLVIFDGSAGGFNIDLLSDGQMLLLAGEPIGEPIFQYGPFVMNTEEEIRTAFRDFAGGAFGTV